MKKIYSFLFAAVALFAAASCQKEMSGNDAPEVKGGEPFAVTAVADAQTKTALHDSNNENSVNWTAGDAIAVFDADGAGVEFTTDITEEAAEAVFEAEEFTAPESFVALYPYQTGLTLSEGVVSGLELKAAQTAKAADFDKTAALTFAKGDDKDALQFNNLYSLLKVTVAEEGITEVKVSATSGSLAGKVTLNVENGTLAVVENQGVSEVTLTGEFAKDGVYYICVLPGTYSGFSISLNGYTVNTKVSDAVLAANTIYDLGNVARTPAPIALIGGFSSWAFDKKIPMYEKDGYYIAEDVAFTGDTEFKFIASQATTWNDNPENYGSDATANVNNAYKNWSGGDNNKLSAGQYDIYLSVNKEFWFVVSAGEPIGNQSIELISDEWGLAGNIEGNNWSQTEHISLYVSGKYLAAKSVKFLDTTGKFKVRQWNNWGGTSLGMSGTTPKSLNSEISLNGGNDVQVSGISTDKTYDIYTDFKTAIVVESGTPVN